VIAGTAMARLSHRNSVAQLDQSKAVQARFTKFSPSSAGKTLVSGF